LSELPDGKRRNLGRGLTALFREEPAQASDNGEGRRPTRHVPTSHVHPGKFQPRRVFDTEALQGLADSIREKGVLQPLLVRPHRTIADAYELIAGERRWRAAQLVPLHEVPVIVKDLDDRDTLEVALIENLQREDLGALEEAEAYQRLMNEFRHSQEELGRVVGKSRSHVANTLRLLGAEGKVRAHLESGSLSAGHARALLGAPDADALADRIVSQGLSVRQTEALVAKGKSPPAQTAAPIADPNTKALERDLSDTLGLQVEIRARRRGGEILFRYKDLDQLDGLLARLRG
jgi:ParB family chromosome partitioning protein